MMMASKMLPCGDCGQEFEWTERDQEFYANKGFSQPKRCKPCREKRKQRFADKKANDARGNPGSRERSSQPARSGNRR
jgi:hypothetical protein